MYGWASENFVDMFPSTYFLLMCFFLYKPGGIAFSQGEPWQELRRFSISALRNFGMGKKSIEYRITEEARVLCDTIAQLNEFEPSSVLYAAVSNIICIITFRRRFDYDDPVFKDMIVRLRTLISGVEINELLRELFIRFPTFLKTSLRKSSRDNLNGLKVNQYLMLCWSDSAQVS